MVSEQGLRQTGLMSEEAQVEALAQELIADMAKGADATAAAPVAEVSAPREAEEINDAPAAEKKE